MGIPIAQLTKLIVAASVASCSAPPTKAPIAPPQAPPLGAPSEATAAALQTHIEFLSDDLLEGREPGTRGYQIAARYAAAQMLLVGAEPAGDYDNSFFQEVPLRSSVVDEATMVLVAKDGSKTAFDSGSGFVAAASLIDQRQSVRADVVFVNHGVVDPEASIDDYAGLDVKGKLVVVLSGAQRALSNEPRAHHSSIKTKRTRAKERGAIGIINVLSLETEKAIPYEKFRKFLSHPRMTWMRSESTPFVEAAIGPGVIASNATAAALFSGAKRSFDEIRTAAESAEPTVPGFELPVQIEITVESIHTRLKSPNVVGMVRGTDPKLHKEFIVLSAHLDHLGIGAAVNGDAIYNGALDNASGSAVVLELARLVAQSPPRRSVLFVLVTAEENGLVGSDYFARKPIDGRMVANLNLDVVIMANETKKLVFFGQNTSSLGAVAQNTAPRHGYQLMPDPIPERVLFTRSDNYSFVKQGIPSLGLGAGFDNGGKLAVEFLTHHHHQPSDQLGEVSFDFEVGARMTAMFAEMISVVGNADAAPRWSEGDFFGELYGKQ